MESHLNFLDPPAVITPEDLSLTDGESFPSHMHPYTRDRTLHMRQHLSWIEDHAKGHYIPCPSDIHAIEPFSVYNAGCLSADLTMNFPTKINSIAYSHSERLLSPPPCTGHPSSSSGLESPRSSNLGDIGCYFPLSCPSDDAMFPPLENYYPSPTELTSAPPDVLQIESDNSPHDLSMGNETISPLDDGTLWIDGTEHSEPVRLSSPVSEETPILGEVSTQINMNRRPRTRRLTSRASRDGVHKPHNDPRSPPRKSHCSRKLSTTSVKSEKVALTGGRQFICSFAHYGCTSNFSSKNEWKRHITSQHLQLGAYRCDIGTCNIHRRSSSLEPPKRARSNHRITHSQQQDKGFNRKDLFIQHLRRMHAPQFPSRHEPFTKEEEANVSQRCWHQQREPPHHSRCGFCDQEFKGERSWDERMEHVGKHFERDEKLPEVEVEDVYLREWAIEEGIIRWEKDGWVLARL